MRLIPGVVNEQGPDSFRLRAEAGISYILEALLAGRRQSLYEFTLQPFELVDFEPFRYWNSTSPDVRWTKQKVCSLPTPEGRVVAGDREFKFYSLDSTQTIRANTDEEYRRML